jgi:DoxX-like family
MVPPIIRTSDGADRSVGHTDHLLRGALWFLQASLAGVFAWVGCVKIVKLGAELTATVPWTIDVPLPLIRAIGVCELLGAVGLVLPAATRVRPHLTPMAASCLTALMALAVTFHLYRGDTQVLIVPAILGLASALVAWGRFRKAPISPRDAAH